MNIQTVKNAVRSLLQNLDRCGISNCEQSIALRELSQELHDDRPPANVQGDFLAAMGFVIALSFAIVFLMVLVALLPLLI